MPALQLRIIVSSCQLNDMRVEALRAFPLETGGIVMGYEAPNCMIVTTIIGPGRRAVHRRRSFTPDTEWQSERVAEVYARSGRTEQYLGDWHTHPRGGTGASLTDLLAARSIARFKPARCPRPLMLIMGVAGPDSVKIEGHRLLRGSYGERK